MTSPWLWFADVLIAALERADAHHRAAAAVLRAMTDEATPLLPSVVKWAETLKAAGIERAPRLP